MESNEFDIMEIRALLRVLEKDSADIAKHLSNTYEPHATTLGSELERLASTVEKLTRVVSQILRRVH